MFIYSVRGSSVRFFAVLVLTFCVLLGVLAVSGTDEVSAVSVGAQSIKFTGIRERADRVAFLSEFGVTVNPDSEVSEEFSVPSQFDRVMNEYNEIQKRQCLDLKKYAGKKVMRYTYEVVSEQATDVPFTADLLIYRNRVVAADVTSVSPEPFVIPLTEFTRKMSSGT